ncbi:DUF2777 domain-containing protein [Bacillus sp. CGMCC 1.16607]|uniref:DUF2777 domain-containing protein n=1 Tax=Bacillus sp. CGMCC 1.16607 TaxID=3351842 RepID=UPI00363BA36F
MTQYQRIKLLENQARAFNEGSVEFINNQWVFFDNETEEASLMEEFLHQEIEIFRLQRWRKGVLFEDGKICLPNETLYLADQDLIRIRKHIFYSLEKILEDMNDDAFFQFVTTLNSLQFSIYDCLYCYNHLSFLKNERGKNGVNFLIFDNQEHIVNVQHHFCYLENTSDRFEFTLNSGKRVVIEKMIS